MQTRTPHRNIKIHLHLPQQLHPSPQINICSQFDSGNLQSATLTNRGIVIQPSIDAFNQSCSLKPSNKTFFSFYVTSNINITATFIIKRMNILRYYGDDYSNFEHYYRVCVKHQPFNPKTPKQYQEYQKIKPDAMKLNTDTQQCELQFKYKLNTQDKIYFAYHYPYPYQRNVNLLHQIKEFYQATTLSHDSTNQLYYRAELLIESLENRAVNLLTITYSNGKTDEQQPRISKSLFPYYDFEGRPHKFNKPYILLTCRVHPGQTSASFALEGILQWLLGCSLSCSHFQLVDRYREEAESLLRNFVFLIVPIINPDGVYNGCYRMDTLGHNLNRFYNSSQSHRQPSVFAIQSLISAYSSKLIFYTDMHSHPHLGKGSFIYGNSYATFHQQVQSQIYAKLLSQVSKCFEYRHCSFSAYQMGSKDANEVMGKDGCGRVYVYRMTGIVNCYTMQMGYHGSPNSQKHQSIYNRLSDIFTIQDYKNHGVAMLISIYQMYNSLSYHHSKIKILRQQISKEIYDKQQRFRLIDPFIYKKLKNINTIILQQIYQPKIIQHFPHLVHGFKTNFLNTNKKPTNCQKVNSLKKIQLSLENIGQSIQNEGGQQINDKMNHYNYHSQTKPHQQSQISIERSSMPISTLRGKRIFFDKNHKDYSPGNQQFSDKTIIAKSPHTYHHASSIQQHVSIHQQQQQHLIFNLDPLRSQKAIKMVRLDFNPFPKFERRGYYNVIAKKQSDNLSAKKSQPKSLKNTKNNQLIIQTNKITTNKQSQQQNNQQNKTYKAVHIDKVNLEAQFLFKLKSNQHNFIQLLPKRSSEDKKYHNNIFPKLPSHQKQSKQSHYSLDKQKKYHIEVQMHKKYQKQYGFQNEIRQSRTRVNARNQIYNIISK